MESPSETREMATQDDRLASQHEGDETVALYHPTRLLSTIPSEIADLLED